MTKPTMDLCAQRRLRSASASTQSDQSLHCQSEEGLGPLLLIKHSVNRASTNFQNQEVQDFQPSKFGSEANET